MKTYRIKFNGKPNPIDTVTKSFAVKGDAKAATMDLILALTEGDVRHAIKAVGDGQFLVYHHGGVDAVDLVEDEQ